MKRAHLWRSSWTCGYRAGPRPAVQGLPHNREGEVKTRLTIGNFGHFGLVSKKNPPKKGDPGPFEPGPRRRGRCRVPSQPLGLLNDLAVQSEIEAFAFDLFGDAEPDDRIDDLEQDQRDDGVIDNYDGDALDLVDHLGGIALDQAGGAAVLIDREYAGEQRTDYSANTMHAEAVECIVRTKDALQSGHAPVAEDAGGHTDCH